MDFRIVGKRAVVSASSGGLGFATAAALVAEGCEVVISGRDGDRLAAAAERLPGVNAIVSDVSTVAGAQRFMDESLTVLGGVDILITNAGGPPKGLARELKPDALNEAMELTLSSAVTMCGAVIDEMVGQGWGRIVAITSQSVRQPMANMVLSNSTRAAVTSYMKTLALEVAGDGVTVNTVQPGSHSTDRLKQLAGAAYDGLGATIPVGYVGDPADFGAVVAFVCSQQARFITGTSIPVAGGTIGGLM
ncbi:MAG: SDR family oxidoreductase [Acidimicrobiales bacterium]